MTDPAKQPDWEIPTRWILSVLPDDALLRLNSFLETEILKNPQNVEDLKRGVKAIEEEIDARLAP